MKKREKILAVLTLLCAVVFVSNQFLCSEPAVDKSKKKKRRTAQPESAGDSAGHIAAETLSELELRERLRDWQPLVTYETWGRDPFRNTVRDAAIEAAADTVELQLSGIAVRGQERLALIGDAILGAGDRGADFMVISVEKDHAVIRRKKRLITLYIGQGHTEALRETRQDEN